MTAFACPVRCPPFAHSPAQAFGACAWMSWLSLILTDINLPALPLAVPGYERVNGLPECLTSCVAAPGEWCGVEGEDTAYNPPSHADDAVLLVFDCPQGFYCPGGR